jgi:hypothetical protein
MMTIQRIGRSGEWIDVNATVLRSRTGFDTTTEINWTMEDLFYQVVDCFGHEDWRLVDGSKVLSEHEAY